KMDDRNALKFIDFEKMTYKGAKLKDTNFPTIDPKNPSKLTAEEKNVIHVLEQDFIKNKKLNKHMDFLYKNGSMYKVENGSLLFHGCIPLTEDGDLQEVDLDGVTYKGKSLM